jgi:hypothetical protein
MESYNRRENVYCYKLRLADTCTAPSPCCDMNLVKIEFFAKNAAQCRGSHVYTIVNGTQKAPSLTSNPGGILKVPQLSFSAETARDVSVCVALRAPCSTPEDLFGSTLPWYTLFDTPSGNRCCVIQKVGA